MHKSFPEIRPIFLRKAERTKAHVLVAMLALKITRHFEALLRPAFGTTDESASPMTPEDALVALGRLLLAVQIRDYPATNRSSDGKNDKGPAKAPCHWM